MSGFGLINAITQSALMMLFAVAGTIPAWVAIVFVAVSLALTTSFYLFTRYGLNQKLDDRGMLMPQLIGNACVQVTFLILAPNLAVLFLLALFVTMGYGAIQFSPRQFMASWLVYGGVTGVSIWLIRDQFSYPGISTAEVGLVWLWFFLALWLQTNTSAQFSHLRDQLSKKNQHLQESLEQIEILARHDYLTGVLNRRCLIENLDEELERANRSSHPFCFVMIDLDHFKQINDNYGHPTGDAVLKAVSTCAMQSLRTIDRFGRLGGEEFGILLPATSTAQGAIAVERLRQAVLEYDWGTIESDLCVTFSAGLAENATNDTVESITKRVDIAMYKAKHEGRNRLVLANVV